MVKEFIEREKALSNIDKAFKMFQDHDDMLRLYSDTRLAVIVEPAADVVEVVRCRECKYWGDEDGKLQRSDGLLFARCKIHNYLLDGRHTGWCPTENNFCSYGELKEGAD